MIFTIENVDLIVLYSALAAVAAITTAIHAAVSLAPLSQVYNLRRRLQSSSAGTQEFNNVITDAQRNKRFYGWLGLVFAVINGAVIASWGNIVVTKMQPEWIFFVPWIAVAAVFLVLISTSILAFCDLDGVSKGKL